MRIGKLRVAVTALGTLALVMATARCGSAQEKVEVEEHDGRSAPFIVSSGGFGGGSYLGVYISEVDAEDVSQLGLKREYGARIEDVSDDSPAQKAGLQADVAHLVGCSIAIGPRNPNIAAHFHKRRRVLIGKIFGQLVLQDIDIPPAVHIGLAHQKKDLDRAFRAGSPFRALLRLRI